MTGRSENHQPMMFRTGYLVNILGRGYGRRRVCAGGHEEDSLSLKRADGPVHMRSHMIILLYVTYECLGVNYFKHFFTPLAVLL